LGKRAAPQMESGELLAPWASTLRREREREEPCRRCSCGCGLVIVFVFGAGSSSSSGGGGAEADNYFGGPGASDRLSSAQVEGAVVEGDEEIDRGPHVGDEDELRATGGGAIGRWVEFGCFGGSVPQNSHSKPNRTPKKNAQSPSRIYQGAPDRRVFYNPLKIMFLS